MKRLLALALLLATACSSGVSAPDETSTAATPERLSLTTVPDAVAINVASNGSDAVLAWVTVEDVLTASFVPEAGQLGTVTAVSGDLTPFAHPIERPALAVRSDGAVDIAFTSHVDNGASVFYVADGSEPNPISGEPRHETNLVHLALSEDDRPIMSWLEDSTLSLAVDSGAGPIETELVDDLSCDCCNPAPIAGEGGSVFVAYRDLETVEGGVVRNVAAVRSNDGGTTFQDPVAIADEDWFLDACPFSGPAAATSEDEVIVAWMDGRQSVHPNQDATTIWVDRTEDGGATFGRDLAVASGAIHRWPVIALDDGGQVHLVWETEGVDGGLSYASSTDGGRTFSEPVAIVGREFNDEGAPHSPSLAIHGTYMLLTWADSSHGYVGVWRLDD